MWMVPWWCGQWSSYNLMMAPSVILCQLLDHVTSDTSQRSRVTRLWHENLGHVMTPRVMLWYLTTLQLIHHMVTCDMSVTWEPPWHFSWRPSDTTQITDRCCLSSCDSDGCGHCCVVSGNKRELIVFQNCCHTTWWKQLSCWLGPQLYVLDIITFFRIKLSENKKTNMKKLKRQSRQLVIPKVNCRCRKSRTSGDDQLWSNCGLQSHCLWSLFIPVNVYINWKVPGWFGTPRNTDRVTITINNIVVKMFNGNIGISGRITLSFSS